MEDSQNWNTMAGRSGQYNFQGYATSEDRALRVLTSIVFSSNTIRLSLQENENVRGSVLISHLLL